MAATTPAPTTGDYPVEFSVDYPDRQLDRLSSALRFLWIIPIAIVLSALSHLYIQTTTWSTDTGTVQYTTWAEAGALLFLAPVLMILFRQKYPKWWFDWNLELMRFQNRVTSYFALLRDEYPSTDEHQAVHLAIPYPDARTDLNRFLPLVKWLLAIPHYIVLAILALGAIFAVIIAWFAILFTGRYPRGLFDYVVGVLRWQNRVTAYAFTMMTDRYPPFRLKA